MSDRNERTIAGGYRQKNITVTATPTSVYDLLGGDTFNWGDTQPAYNSQLDLLGDGSGDVLYRTLQDGDDVSHAAGGFKPLAFENAIKNILLSVASGTETITVGMWF